MLINLRELLLLSIYLCLTKQLTYAREEKKEPVGKTWEPVKKGTHGNGLYKRETTGKEGFQVSSSERENVEYVTNGLILSRGTSPPSPCSLQEFQPPPDLVSRDKRIKTVTDLYSLLRMVGSTIPYYSGMGLCRFICPTSSPIICPIRCSTSSPSICPTRCSTSCPTFSPTRCSTTCPIVCPTRCSTTCPTRCSTSYPTICPALWPTCSTSAEPATECCPPGGHNCIKKETFPLRRSLFCESDRHNSGLFGSQCKRHRPGGRPLPISPLLHKLRSRVLRDLSTMEKPTADMWPTESSELWSQRAIVNSSTTQERPQPTTDDKLELPTFDIYSTTSKSPDDRMERPRVQWFYMHPWWSTTRGTVRFPTTIQDPQDTTTYRNFGNCTIPDDTKVQYKREEVTNMIGNERYAHDLVSPRVDGTVGAKISLTANKTTMYSIRKVFDQTTSKITINLNV